MAVPHAAPKRMRSVNIASANVSIRHGMLEIAADFFGTADGQKGVACAGRVGFGVPAKNCPDAALYANWPRRRERDPNWPRPELERVHGQRRRDWL